MAYIRAPYVTVVELSRVGHSVNVHIFVQYTEVNSEHFRLIGLSLSNMAKNTTGEEIIIFGRTPYEGISYNSDIT